MKVFYTFLFTLLCASTFSQDTSSKWTWVSGNQLNQPAVYGTKGVASPSNFPGSRISAASWATPDGNLWIFGGIALDSNGYNVTLNDLWMYDATTNVWTWKHGPSLYQYKTSVSGTIGVASAANLPTARSNSSNWSDKSGNLWFYGGTQESGRFFLADLWKFDPQVNMWTWVSGNTGAFDEGEYGVIGVPDPVSRPGNRTGASATVDHQGNFWMVGGQMLMLYLEDIYITTRSVWKFDPASQLWTYYKTEDPVYNTLFNPSNFGTKGVPSPDNSPPSRYEASLWADSTGHLYWYGGTEIYFIGAGSDDLRFDAGIRNDLWRYDTLTKIWTWIHGSKDRYQYGHYGTKGMADSANTPGARARATTFKTVNGKMMLFGGEGKAEDSAGALNDLWSFDAAMGQWTWLSGSEGVNQPGMYGQKGVPDSMNIPGARVYAAGFVDASDHLWIYGGSGYVSDSGSLNPSGALSDLWKLNSVEISEEVFESFRARDRNGYVQLNWKITKSQATDYMVVEHSTNGNNYERLGRVRPPRNGRSRSYSYIHVFPGKGDHYYRVQHVATGGQTDYSDVEKLTFNNPYTLPHHFNISFLLFPNPVKNWLYMTLRSSEAANMHVVVYNEHGQPIMQQKQIIYPGTNTVKMNLNNYKPGSYSVVVFMNGKKYSKRVIKL